MRRVTAKESDYPDVIVVTLEVSDDNGETWKEVIASACHKSRILPNIQSFLRSKLS